jgi:hypothetical protein
VSGCDAAGDAVSGAASRAGCEVAQRAVDEVAQQARSTAADLGADPAAAQQRLDGLRETLSTAEQGLDGETREQVTRAREAVEALATQAGQAADGTQVDDVAVQEAEQELDAAVTRLTDVC